MWDTSTGKRTLDGPEASLVAMVIDTIVDDLAGHLSDPENMSVWRLGVHVFDSLCPSQKAWVLHLVAKHLLLDTPQTLTLSAVSEGAVGAIFAAVSDLIVAEIQTSNIGTLKLTYTKLSGWPYARHDNVAEFHYQSWRKRVWDAYVALGPDEWDDPRDRLSRDPIMTPLSVNDCTISRWDLVIETLADQILWDRDYLTADYFGDAEPHQTHQYHQSLGIEHEYYTATSPDPNIDQVPQFLNAIHLLIRPFID